MNDRVLSTVATIVTGLPFIVLSTDGVQTWPSGIFGFVFLACGVGMVVTGLVALAFPDATVLGKSLNGDGMSRRRSLAVIVLASGSLVLSLVAP